VKAGLYGTSNDLHAHNRIPTEFEEIVVYANRFHPQHLLPNRGQDLFGVRLGRPVSVILFRLQVMRAREGFTVYFTGVSLWLKMHQ